MTACRLWLCALASLSALQDSAALPVEPGCNARDNVLLVQKSFVAREGDLYVDTSGALAPLSPSEEALLLRVADVVEQLRVGLPSRLPFALPKNVSMDDLMTIGVKIFNTFKNESFVAALHELIGNTTVAWAEFMNIEEEATAKLDTSCNGEPMETTFAELESYFRAGEAGLRSFLAKVASYNKEVERRQPDEVKTIRDALNASSASEDSNTSNASDANSTGFAVPEEFTADFLFSDMSEVCSKFQGIWPNLTALESALQSAVSFLKDSEKTVQRWEGLIEVLAPDVVDRVMGVVNASVQAALNMSASDLALTKPALAAMKAELEGCLSCTLPDVAGTLRGGPSVLISMVTALAAWLALRH